MGRQVTGGSLKESREALEIAETDGKPSCLPACCGSLTAAALGGACNVFGEMLLRRSLVCDAGRLFCTVGVHPTRCGVAGIFRLVFAIVV